MSSLLASVGGSALNQISDALREAVDERLWAKSDGEVIDRVQAALRVKAQADAVLLAVAASGVSLAQARVIIRAVGELPEDVGPELAAAGECLMVGHCAAFDAATLALIGRRLAECIDPEGTQARDEKKLLEREKTAHDKRGLTISTDKDGAGRYVRGYLSGEGAAIIAAALDGLSAPIPATAAGDKDTQSPAQRRHDALIELGRRQLQTGQLPATGGIKPRIVITIPAQSWAGRTGSGRLNDGAQISPSLAAYLGCDAEIVPAFLDGAGNLINLGRARRTFTGPARTALELRDRGCAWPGCRAAGLIEGDSE